jgi:ribosomal protein S18 acetylase RimI-like enzyme
MTIIREARLPEDAWQIRQIDSSFTTDEIYAAYRDENELILRSTPLPTPLTKGFPMDALDQKDRPWDFALVAIADDRICGFLAAEFEAWRRRLTIWHLYVNILHRRRGIARLLVDRAQAHGATTGALNLWLETSSTNVPAVKAYRKLGFELCGMDTTFYNGTPASAETALFFTRPIGMAPPGDWP